jgi:F-type H+-transporting ATPase subunit b
MISPLATHFADSSSGIGALGVDGKAFLIQLVTFLLAYLVLRRYAFGPILKVLRERRQIIENGVKLGEEMQKEKVRLEQQVETILHNARTEADDIINAAQQAGRQAVREAEDKARSKAAAILKEADERIVQDTVRARQQLEAELAGLVSETTEAIIEEKLDARKDASLIERFLKKARVTS